MRECAFCNLSVQDKRRTIYENSDWIVFLADKQDYIGRCIVVCKTHCESLSNLNIEQWISLKVVVNSLENMLKCELGATMFNWSCLMNDSYKSDYPKPHLHFHMRPRYAKPVIINGRKYEDDEFAHHYNNKKQSLISDCTTDLIFQMLKEKVDSYFTL